MEPELTESRIGVGLSGLANRVGRALIYRAPGEVDQCVACQSQRLVVLDVRKLPAAIAGRRWGFVSGCKTCGLVFVNPLPSEAVLSSMYGPQGEWSLAHSDQHSNASGKSGSGTWRRMFDAIRDDLDVTRPPAGSCVLDFGCGTGKFLDVLQQCGWNTYGIEPAMDVAFSRHHRLTTVPDNPQFDLVIAHHVLEHVTNPLALLRQFAAAARDSAYLLVAVPRFDTLPVHRDYGYMLGRVHVTAYTRTCMEGLLARAGWQPVEPPPDDVVISGGRRTTVRLRILARRATGRVSVPMCALRPASKALRAYVREAESRSIVEQLGAIRLTARIRESRRQFKRLAGALRMALRHVAR